MSLNVFDVQTTHWFVNISDYPSWRFGKYVSERKQVRKNGFYQIENTFVWSSLLFEL